MSRLCICLSSNLPAPEDRALSCPVVTLYKQDVETKKYGYISQGVRIENDNNPTFPDVFSLSEDCMYKFCVYDVKSVNDNVSADHVIGVCTATYATLLAGCQGLLPS